MAVKKVQRRGRTMWRARVVIDGRHHVAFRERKDEAQQAETELRARANTQMASEAAERPAEVPTLAEFQEDFMKRAATENGRAEVAKKEQLFRDHLLPTFGHLRLDKITAKVVDAYKADKLRPLDPDEPKPKRGKPRDHGLKPATVAHHVSVLKRVLNVAREWGVLPTVPKIRQVRIPQQDFDFLGFDEAERFIAAAGEWRAFVLVALRTGLRQGELRGLQWGDVDLVGARVRVARAFTQTGWALPKSGRGRTVDLPWDATELLTSIKPRKAGRTELVFPGGSGEPLDERAIYDACEDIAKAAEIGRHVHPHMLRHTFASHHAMRGTPLLVIQQWMGHASITTTMRYAHLCPSTTASYADNAAPARGPRVVSARAVRRGRGGSKVDPHSQTAS